MFILFESGEYINSDRIFSLRVWEYKKSDKPFAVIAQFDLGSPELVISRHVSRKEALDSLIDLLDSLPPD